MANDSCVVRAYIFSRFSFNVNPVFGCRLTAKLYTSKTPITAADLLNERVLPYYEEHQLPVVEY